MEEEAIYRVKGAPRPPKLEKTIIYVEGEELEKLRQITGPFNQKSKEGGVSGKIRELIKLYNKNPDALEDLIQNDCI
jgi:hypothetical protein